MATVLEARAALERYTATLRRPDLPPLEISGVYVLFPGTSTVSSEPEVGRWPDDPWPFAARCGVYLFFDASHELVYVGKASWGPIGARLENYFKRAPDGSCHVVHDRPGGWRTRPEYLMVVAVPEALPFEAAALEGFLIRELRPRDNTIGVPETRPT